MVTGDDLLCVEEVARMLKSKPASLYSKVWRTKIGLPGVKIGTSIRFRREDVVNVIERGREVLPPMPGVLTEVSR